MSSGFPLLRTPQTVQTQIFNELNNYEAATVAMCSKKAYQHVKLCRSKSKKWSIDLKSNCITLNYNSQKMCRHIKNPFRIGPFARIERPKSWSSSLTEIVDFNGYKVPVNFSPMFKFCMFWDDEALGLNIVTEYICNLFKIDIYGAIIEKSNLWIIDWLNSRQESYGTTEIEGLNRPALSDEEYRHILTDCKATDQLKLTAAASDDFVFTGNFPKAEILTISPSRWVTVDNLKTMDSINVRLGESNLSSFDINVFLKHWLDGGSPRLTYMKVFMQTIIWENILFCLEAKDVSTERKFTLVDGRSENFKESYDIERKDGAKLSVVFNEKWFCSNMCIVVWPAPGKVN